MRKAWVFLAKSCFLYACVFGSVSVCLRFQEGARTKCVDAECALLRIRGVFALINL